MNVEEQLKDDVDIEIAVRLQSAIRRYGDHRAREAITEFVTRVRAKEKLIQEWYGHTQYNGAAVDEILAEMLKELELKEPTKESRE